MRATSILLATILCSSANCLRAADESSPQDDCANQFDFQSLLKELRVDFPFRAGMTVEKVEQLFDENNQKLDALQDEDSKKNKAAGTFAPPIFADRDLHLYAYVDVWGDNLKLNRSARRYWVNGRTQFWVAMAIEDGKVKNIYITPGNFGVVLQSLLFDGEGDDVGYLPNAQERRLRPHNSLAK